MTDSTIYKQRTFELHDTAGQLQALHDDGFALIPNVLSSDEVATARDAIDGLTPVGFDRRGEGETDHFKCVFNRDPYWLGFLDRPGIIELAEAAMGPQCHIIGQTAWRSHPGHNGWGPHTDRLFFPMEAEALQNGTVKLPIFLCTAHFYLSDITEDLAPTYVFPGSHKSGTNETERADGSRTWNREDFESVICKAGDALVFRSEIWHSGSLNKTVDQTRYLLQSYSHRFVAQQFSPYLRFQFNPDVLDAANERQLRLLGNHPQGAYD